MTGRKIRRMAGEHTSMPTDRNTKGPGRKTRRMAMVSTNTKMEITTWVIGKMIGDMAWEP